MLQKTQWTLVATVLAMGALIAPGARPAQAQKRIRLTAPVKAPLPTGIQTGIVKPPITSTAAPVYGPPAPAAAPTVAPPAPVPAPVVKPPAPAPAPSATPPAPPAPVVAPRISTPTVTPRTNLRTSLTPTRSPAPAPAPTFQSAPQGFSAGPTLLGQPRIPLGYMVNRIPPDFDGDGYIEHRKPAKRR